MAHENRALRANGDITIFRKTVTGEQPGVGPLNGSVLSFASSSETVKIPDKRRGRRGQNMKVLNDPSAPTGKLKLYSVPSRVLAMLMLGTIVTRTDGSGAVVDEEVSVPVDYWVPLAHRNVSSVIVTSDPAGTTYVNGTDYEVDKELGLIRLIDGGSLSATTDLLVSYDYAAVTGERIKVSTETTVRARIIVKGENDAEGTNFEWEAYSALLTPDGEFDLMSSEPVQAEFSLEFETPDGYDHPIRFDQNLVYA